MFTERFHARTSCQTALSALQYEYSRFRVNFGALLHEFFSFLFQPPFNRLLFVQTLLGRIFPHVFGDFHAAKMRTAHGTEMSQLCAFLRKSFVVKLASGAWVKA